MTIQDPIQCAYAAGLFDGEGCISAKVVTERGLPRATVNVIVAMTDLRPLLALDSAFGGSIRFAARKGNRKGVWAWTLGSKASAQFLTAVLPYLRVKREEAVLALQLYSRIGNGSHHCRGFRGSKPPSQDETEVRLSFVRQIKDLKHVGKL